MALWEGKVSVRSRDTSWRMAFSQQQGSVREAEAAASKETQSPAPYEREEEARDHNISDGSLTRGRKVKASQLEREAVQQRWRPAAEPDGTAGERCPRHPLSPERHTTSSSDGPRAAAAARQGTPSSAPEKTLAGQGGEEAPCLSEAAGEEAPFLERGEQATTGLGAKEDVGTSEEKAQATRSQAEEGSMATWCLGCATATRAGDHAREVGAHCDSGEREPRGCQRHDRLIFRGKKAHI